MGQVGITNPFRKVSGEEWGVPGMYPTGVGRLGAIDCQALSTRMGPPTKAEQDACKAHPAWVAPMRQSSTELLTQLSEHLNQSSFGVPNWFLYAGAGVGAWLIFGGKR